MATVFPASRIPLPWLALLLLALFMVDLSGAKTAPSGNFYPADDFEPAHTRNALVYQENLGLNYKGTPDTPVATESAVVNATERSVVAAKGGAGLSTEAQSFLEAAESPFKGQTLTNAGRATTKHPEYFGFSSTEELRAVYRTDAQLNALANTNVQEILSNGVRTTGAGGRYPSGWVTYTLPDGRAASWTASGEFIGFRGL
jgi:hypothetical protein